MNAVANGPGFLGTKATFRSDVTLALIIFTAVLFTIGWQRAARKHYEAHHWVQTVAVFLNTVAVLSIMIPSFVTHILPGIPGKLLEGDYGITTAHAFVGMIAASFGVFVALRANNLVPRGLRFKDFKVFMRTSYVLYMLATLMGIVVYVLVYVYGI
jgi:uncharacterized membrane protein YozB (DUF420 family)